MEKCNVNLSCEEIRNLILDVDLRTDADVRIRKLARKLLPLNEHLGEFQLSVSLSFLEGEAARYMNLSVYVTENEQERVLHVLFPPEIQVTIFKEGKETAINFLEYHINKRTEIITEVSGINPYEQNCGHNVLTLDISDIAGNTDWTQNEELLASVLEQATKISDWNKPLDFIIWDSPVKNFCEIMEINIHDNFIRLIVRVPCNYISIFMNGILNILIDFSENEVVIGNVVEQRRDLIFLYEDNDAVISGGDFDRNNALAKAQNWNVFANELIHGNQPAVYLASPTSGKYCPVAYTFELDKTTKQLRNLVMDISYYKEVDGQFQLWIERRRFPEGCAHSSVYDHDDNGKPLFYKFALTPVTGETE